MKKLLLTTIALIAALSHLSAQGDDDCNNASIENIDCTHMTVNYTAGSASGPDPEAASCIGPDLYWFAFSFDPSVPEIDISGSGDVSIWEGSDCSSMAEIDCSSSSIIVIDPSQIYFMAVEDGESFDLTTLSMVGNDLCDAVSYTHLTLPTILRV